VKDRRTPLWDLQGDAVSEATVQRLWHRIEAKRARASRPRTSLAWASFAFGASALMIALVVGLWARRGREPVVAAGPLLLAGGAEVTDLAYRSDAPPPEPVRLADGSTITLHPGAHLHALESTATSFSLLLRSGDVDFAVQKGGPRRWSIECGLATVEVVGTRFTTERSAGRVRVSVAEGIVLVRGERVPDRVQRLVAGESLEVTDGPAAALDGEAGGDAPVAPIATASTAPPPSAATVAPIARAWRELARKGAYSEAYRALGRQSIADEATGGSVEELLMLADVARLSGHPAEAIAPLSRVIEQHPGDARAALAAFTLGRLELDTLGHPGVAADAFARALALGLGASLVEDAQARLVEARARAGDHQRARAAAAEYEQRFATGRHLAAVRRWVAEVPPGASSAGPSE
jgi:transmembrane sensor